MRHCVATEQHLVNGIPVWRYILGQHLTVLIQFNGERKERSAQISCDVFTSSDGWLTTEGSLTEV